MIRSAARIPGDDVSLRVATRCRPMKAVCAACAIEFPQTVRATRCALPETGDYRAIGANRRLSNNTT